MADLGEIGIDRLELNGPRYKFITGAWSATNAQTEVGRVGIVFTGSTTSRRFGTYRRLIPFINATITGTVKEEGVLVSRKVRLFRKADGEFCGETFSDPTTGVFSFSGLRLGDEYTVVAYDHNDVPDFNALIYDKVLPV